MSNPAAPFPDFVALNDSTSYLQQIPNANLPTDPVSLIVLCTWMSAPRRPIAKYITPYRSLYPTAEILVLESSLPSTVFANPSAKRQVLAPALEIIAKHAAPPGQPSRTILHAFSNGGGMCAAELANNLPFDRRPTAWKATIADSCPGGFEYTSFVTAIYLSLPRTGLLNYASLATAHLMACIATISVHVFGSEMFERPRRTWNDATVFGKATPRLYLYSDADELVKWQHVEEHAEDAKAKGYERVEMRRFEGSRHCAHAMRFGEEYWGFIEKVIASAR